MQGLHKLVLFYRNSVETYQSLRTCVNLETDNLYNLQVSDDVLSTMSIAIEGGRIPTNDECEMLKKDILSKRKSINNVNFDATVIGCCITHKNYEAAKSYIKFIESKNIRPNTATLGKFMKLYYVAFENQDALYDEEDFIISMYLNLKKEYPILDSITAENVIHALSLTNYWMECIRLIDEIKVTAFPSASTYSAVVNATFKNDEYDLGWSLLEEMISHQRLPFPYVYNTWIDKIETNKLNPEEHLKKLLKFWANNDVLPTKDVTDDILSVLKSNFDGAYTIITTKGMCHNCNKFLRPVKLNKEDFEPLKNAFMDNVIIGKGIFHKTTPQELEKFKDFLEKIGPCNVVIDGLNVAYLAGNKQNHHVYGKLLSSVVQHYHDKYGKVLVLGRVHMNKWPKQYFDFIKKNAEIFLTQNLSQDDPFLLYATMSSGLGTIFVSRDFMRGHVYLLMDPQLKILFRRWQQMHQHSVAYIETSGTVTIKTPFPCLQTVQENDDGWHIPYVNNHMTNPPASFEPPADWLCIRKKRKSKTENLCKLYCKIDLFKFEIV